MANLTIDAQFNAVGSVITGKVHDTGVATIEVFEVETNTSISSTTSNGNGNFTASLSKNIFNGSKARVVATSGSNTGSIEISGPNVASPILYSLALNNDGDIVTGRTEPNIYVKAELRSMYSNYQVGETTSLSNGSFTIKMNTPATDRNIVYITAYDAEGNPSTVGEIISTKDTTAPDLSAYLDTDSKTIHALSEPGIDVMVRNPITGENIKGGTTDEQGRVTIVLDTVLFRGKRVDVVAVDQAGNESDPINLEGTFVLENPKITHFSISPLGNVVTFNTNKEIKSAVMINNTTGVTTPFYVDRETYVNNIFPHPIAPGNITINVVDTDDLVATLSFSHQGFGLVHATKEWVVKNVVLVPEPPNDNNNYILKTRNGLMYWEIDNNESGTFIVF